MSKLEKENERLKQAINFNIFANDNLDQKNCRENIQIYGVLRLAGKKNDGKDVLFQIAEELNIELDEWDIQTVMAFIWSERSGRSRPPLQKCRKAATLKYAAKHPPPKNATKQLPLKNAAKKAASKYAVNAALLKNAVKQLSRRCHVMSK